MNKKIIFCFLFFVLFFSSAFCLSFRAEKSVFFKGETIVFSGNASKSLVITAFQNKSNIIFQENVPLDVNGDFVFKYSSSFLDAKGDWNVSAIDSNTKKSIMITVNPVRESEFFLVSFLSPAPRSFKRLEKFDIIVRVSDAGKTVESASVNYWDITGKRKSMKSSGNGLYSDTIELPLDAKLGDWKLIVSAQKRVSGQTNGGEKSVALKIDPAEIILDSFEPKVSEFITGRLLNIKFRALYSTGEPVNSFSSARIVVDNTQFFDFNKTADGFLSAQFDPVGSKVSPDSVNVRIELFDSAKNSFTKTITFRPIGELFWFLRTNAMFYLIPALFIFYILFLSGREIIAFATILQLKRRKKMLMELKKRLQEDYFVDNIISRQDYEKQEQEYDSELNDIDSRLSTLEAKKELL